MFKRQCIFFIAAALFMLTASSVRGQNDMPEMDRKGNYKMSFGPVASNVKYGGASWRVVSRRLPIRQGPSVKTKILSTLKKGDVIAAYIGRGGSDEVLVNEKASNGWTWMRVVIAPGKLDQYGYVRANARFIRPVLPPNVAEAPVQFEADGADDEDSGDTAAPAAGKPAPVKGSELAGVAGVAQLPAGTAGGQVIDKVVFNDAASEQKHKVSGKNTDSGDLDGRGYRGAVEGGEFSFQLAGKAGQPVDLVLSYNGDDEGSTFNVLVDGTVIARQTLKKNEAGRFFDIRYRLAPGVTKNQSAFTVTLQALPPKNIAGGCFGARTETVK